MPTLAQLRDRVDTFVSNHWSTVVARQENYRANKGQYWQGLLTHTNIPNHLSGGFADAIADRLNINPTDQFENWKNVFPEWDGVALPAALQVDVYDGPSGKGWTITVWVKFNGTIYTRTVNVGPENWRAKPWDVFTPEE